MSEQDRPIKTDKSWRAVHRKLGWGRRVVRIAGGVVSLVVGVFLLATAMGAAGVGVVSGDLVLIAVAVLSASFGYLLVMVARVVLKKPLRLGGRRYSKLR